MESIKQFVERRSQAPVITEGADVAFRCVVCEDTYWERYLDDQKRLWARPCGCKASLPVNIENCPEPFRSIRLDAIERHAGNIDQLKQVTHWVPRGRDLYLHGRAGRGKTMLACVLATEIGKSARFEVVDTLLRELVQEDEQGARWVALRTVPVLILDDIGTADSEWARRSLVTLYSERLAKQKRTIFTSNKSLKELVDMWQDERLGSRIVGAADIVELEGPDFRRRHGNHSSAR